MAEAPIMPLATDAYLADTTHLSTLEHGAYLLLLMSMWRAGGRLPNDPVRLARFCRLSPGQFRRIWPALEGFFYVDGDQLGQGKCDDFLEAVRRKSKSASDSARAKWRKNKKQAHADASSPQCGNDAIQDPANQEPKKNPPKPPKGGGIDDAEFEEWWALYPRKIAKGTARRAYVKARKKTDADTLKSAIRRFAAKVVGKEAEFIPYAASWLNGERWGDEDRVNVEPAQESQNQAEARIATARDWLSRHNTIPDWMDNADTAERLLAEGYDYEQLRRAGFGLPPRNVIDIGECTRQLGDAKRVSSRN